MRGVLFPTQPQYRWLCASVSNRIPLAYRASAYPFSLRTSNWGERRASISHLPGSHPGALPIELRPPLQFLYVVIGVQPTIRQAGAQPPTRSLYKTGANDRNRTCVTWVEARRLTVRPHSLYNWRRWRESNSLRAARQATFPPRESIGINLYIQSNSNKYI